MHRSQLAGIIIDCKTDDLRGSANFWANALGTSPNSETFNSASPYVELQTRPEQIYVEVQQVDHASRVHLDIESDDIVAEAKRLEALGAKIVGNIKSWIVMEAPTGQRFCVVPVTSADFEKTAQVWD